jgi:transcriptional regulator with XRE-family HTH domain
MAEEQKQPYGAWLRETRKARGLTLVEVSEVIRIDVAYLQALESGNIAILPEPYIRAFLKTYAGHLGLDPEEALRRIEEFMEEQSERLENVRLAAREMEGRWYPDGTRELPVPDEIGKTDVEEDESSPPARSQLVIAAAVVLFIAVVVFLAIRLTGGMGDPGDQATGGGTTSAISGEGTSDEPTLPSSPVTADTASGRESITQQQAAPRPPVARRPATGLQLLRAEAIETTWIQAIADGADTIVSRTVAAGNSINVPFRDSLVVKAGKNHGMRLLLNGIEVTDLGPPGMVLSRLVLTRDGVVSRRITQPPGQEFREPGGQVAFRQHR